MLVCGKGRERVSYLFPKKLPVHSSMSRTWCSVTPHTLQAIAAKERELAPAERQRTVEMIGEREVLDTAKTGKELDRRREQKGLQKRQIWSKAYQIFEAQSLDAREHAQELRQGYAKGLRRSLNYASFPWGDAGPEQPAFGAVGDNFQRFLAHRTQPKTVILHG